MFTVHYNATISPDQIVLTNTATGETVARTTLRPFSTRGRMIADPASAASFLGELIRQVEGRKRWLRFWPTIDVNIIGEPRAKLDEEEVKRLFVEQGFARVRLT